MTDALGRKVMTYDYDMLSAKIQQVSMDTGNRWVLNDVAGKPIRAWDSRGHTVRTTYDRLQRPAQLFVREGSGDERLVERTTYGEPITDDPVADAAAKALNLRGKALSSSMARASSRAMNTTSRATARGRGSYYGNTKIKWTGRSRPSWNAKRSRQQHELRCAQSVM